MNKSKSRRSASPSERIIVNKLGMKFDPVCYKKNHEKGRIQFICIQDGCNLHRLGCAHCIIEEHDSHVQNKITIEQYCNAFEHNYKQYLISTAKIEEQVSKQKFREICYLIDKDIDQLIEQITMDLLSIKNEYIRQVEKQTISLETSDQIRIEKGKMKEYYNKNVFEMIPSELDHSMLLIGPDYLRNLENIVEQSNRMNQNEKDLLLKQWKLIKEQIDITLTQTIQQIVTLQPFENVSSAQPSTQISPMQGIIELQAPEPAPRPPLQQVKQISVTSGLVSPFKDRANKSQSPFQTQQQGTSNKSNKSSMEMRGDSSSKPIIPNRTHCMHNVTQRTLPIFNCCRTAYPCYECHDMACSHKAHITQPSQRLCPKCQEIFSVNQLSTKDVKCVRCEQYKI